MLRQLDVWLTGAHPGTLIGTLTQAEGRLAFRYRSEWLASDHATPLSQSLPLQADEFDDKATRPFFAGLLPGATNAGLWHRRWASPARTTLPCSTALVVSARARSRCWSRGRPPPTPRPQRRALVG